MEWLFASPEFFIVAVVIFSLNIGSFLNVLIYRLPIMLERQFQAECHSYFEQAIPAPPTDRFNLSLPRSHCPQCKNTVKAIDNIPLLSWLFLRGKCRHCKHPISARYPLVELLTAVVAGVTAYTLGPSYWTLAVVGASCVLIALCFIDLDTMLLPDNLTLPLMWAGILAALTQLSPLSLTDSVIGAMGGYLSLWSVYKIFKLLTGKEGMGYGDFKLLAALGAWLGWQALPMVILIASVVGAIGGIITLRMQASNTQTPFSFGPYLAIAGWIGLLWGNQIINWYLTSYVGF